MTRQEVGELRMRRWLVLAVLLGRLGLPSSLWSQEVSVGIQAGPVLAGILFQDPYSLENTGVKTAFQLGVPFRLALSDRWGLRTGLRFARKGFDDAGAFPGSQTLDYLEVPLLADIRMPWLTSVHFMAGPLLSYELRCRISGVAQIGSTTCDDPLVSMERKPLDLGVVVGLGVDREVGGIPFTLDVQGALGLRDLKKEALPPGYAQNMAVYFSLGILYPWQTLFGDGRAEENR